MAKAKSSANIETADLENVGAAISGLFEVVRKGLESSFALVENQHSEINKNVQRTKENIERGAHPGRKPFRL
jgi:hypothetical protein